MICAKALGKKACLIERHYMGGDCLNVRAHKLRAESAVAAMVRLEKQQVG